MTILKWPCIPLKTTLKKKFPLKLHRIRKRTQFIDLIDVKPTKSLKIDSITGAFFFKLLKHPTIDKSFS